MIRFDGIIIDRKRYCIARNGITMHFLPRRNRPSVKFRLACALLLAGPQTKKELFDLAYGDDPEGGPLDPKTIDVMIWQVKQQFAGLGIEVRREGTYTFKRYFAVPVEICGNVYLEAAE